MKKRIPNAEDKYSIEIEMGLLDEKTQFLVGWPGYRTYFNKSGLGYVETIAEEAHMVALMLRWLVTGKFRTHNPVYLVFMAFIALLLGVLPLFGMLLELLAGNFTILLLLTVASPHIFIGVLLLINVILSLQGKEGRSITGD